MAECHSPGSIPGLGRELKQPHLPQPRGPGAGWKRSDLDFLGEPELAVFSSPGAAGHGDALRGIEFGVAAGAEDGERGAIGGIVGEVGDVEEPVGEVKEPSIQVVQNWFAEFKDRQQD